MGRPDRCLHDGRADVSSIRCPADQSGLQIQGPCWPAAATGEGGCVPQRPPDAGKDTISIADLPMSTLQDTGVRYRMAYHRRRNGTRTAAAACLSATVEENSSSGPRTRHRIAAPCPPRCLHPPRRRHSPVSDIRRIVCPAWEAPSATGSSGTFAAIATCYTRPRRRSAGLASARNTQPASCHIPAYHKVIGLLEEDPCARVRGYSWGLGKPRSHLADENLFGAMKFRVGVSAGPPPPRLRPRSVGKWDGADAGGVIHGGSRDYRAGPSASGRIG